MSNYAWIHCNSYALPHNAVKCGKDLDGSDIYVGKAHHKGDEIPAKIIPSRHEAFVAYEGKEVPVHGFSVLVENPLKWVKGSGGRVPAAAVPGGKTSSGEILYIGRTVLQNIAVMGKIHPSHGCLYVSFNGKEARHDEYEVLTA